MTRRRSQFQKPRAAGILPGGSTSSLSARAARGPFTIAMDGEVGGEIRAAAVREALAAAGDDDVEIRINSIGGSVTEGMAIYQAIRRSKSKTTGYVEGIAASMASVILQACDVRVVAAGAYVMIHNPSSLAAGESDDLRRTADLLDKMASDLLDIYETRSGMDRDKIHALMDAETYMTAEEAVEMGFADRIDDKINARVSLQAVAKLNPEKVPESLRALAKGKAMTEEEMKAKIRALEEENAKLKAEKEEPEHNAEDDDEGEEKEEKAEEDDDDKEKAKAILAVARRVTGARSLSEIEGKLMALGAAAKVERIANRESTIKQLVAEGRLAPADVAWAKSTDDRAFAAYCKAVAKAQVVPVGHKHGEPVGSAPGSAPGSATAVPGAVAELTEDEKKFARLSGLSKEQIIAARTNDPVAELEL